MPYYPPSGALAIGAPVGGAAAGDILYVGPGGLLAKNADLTFDEATDKTISGVGAVDVRTANQFHISHKAMTTAAQSALFQSDVGATFIGAAAGQDISFLIAGGSKWKINSSGHLVAAADGSFDIGTGITNRPRNVWVSGTVVVGGAGSSQVTVRGGPSRFHFEAGSSTLCTIEGNMPAGHATVTEPDVLMGASLLRTAGWIVRMDINMVSGSAGTRLWGMKFDGRVFQAVPNAAPTDADLQNSEVTQYVDQAANTLNFRVKYSDGTLKSGTVALA
jgi:hypothetical protein